MGGRVLGGGAATIEIARVSFRRSLRTRALIGAALVAALPVVMAVIFQAVGEHEARGVYRLAELCAAVLVGLAVAGPLGEELEDRTIAYLWARPLPHWSLVTGKLLALVPVVSVMAAAMLAVALAAGNTPTATIERAAGALAGGVAVRACIGAAMGTLLPRQALALTVGYLFFVDLPLGFIPARLQVVSIVYHENALAGLATGEGTSSAVIGLAAIGLVWLAVALWRVRRIE